MFLPGTVLLCACCGRALRVTHGAWQAAADELERRLAEAKARIEALQVRSGPWYGLLYGPHRGAAGLDGQAGTETLHEGKDTAR